MFVWWFSGDGNLEQMGFYLDGFHRVKDKDIRHFWNPIALTSSDQHLHSPVGGTCETCNDSIDPNGKQLQITKKKWGFIWPANLAKFLQRGIIKLSKGLMVNAYEFDMTNG